MTTPAAEYAWTLFGQCSVLPGTVQPGGLTGFTQCMQFSLTQDARVTGIWWYSPDGGTILPQQCGIFLDSTQALILVNASPAWSGTAGAGWVKCTFDGSFPLFAGAQYQVAVYSGTSAGYYAATSGFWTSGGTGEDGLTNGIVTAPDSSASAEGQGSYSDGNSELTYPDLSGAGANYWVDIEVTTGIPAPSPPVPGFGLAAPRTWSPGDLVTVPRLRADVYNLAALAGQGRPALLATAAGDIPYNTVALADLSQPQMNSWNTLLTQGAALAAGPGTATFYPVPLPGWYLAGGWTGQVPLSGGSASTLYSWGVIYTQGTALYATRTDLGQVAGPPAGTFPVSSSEYVGSNGCELLQLNPATGDVVGIYAYTTNLSGSDCYASWSAEWVGLPSSGTINGYPYTGPVGSVVADPRPAAPWPAGPGGTLTAAVAAGGSVLSMPPVAGLRAGGTIGVDWLSGRQYQPYAETAGVASVAGGSVTLSGTLSYAHAAGAPVAVPVSAALLNEQVRDLANFAFYPPLLRAVQGTHSAQSIPASTWTTVDLALTGSGITGTLDNFGGWAATTANSYTIQVSGVYLVAGQVYFTGSESGASWGARLIDNDGNTYPGEFYATDSGAVVEQAPSVQRVLRLTAGQTIALQAWQSSGASVETNPTSTASVGSTLEFLPRLVIVFRGF